MDLTITRPPIDSASSDGLKPTSVTGRITIENVSFHYPSRPEVPILKNLSLTFGPNTTTALVGASGSGKSTVVSLVERFYDPDLEHWGIHHDGEDSTGGRLAHGLVFRLHGFALRALNPN